MNMSRGTNNTSGLDHVVFQVGGTQQGSINTNTSGSGTVYSTTSDYRLKTDITPIDINDSINRLMHAKPVDFIWTTTNAPSRGFIAHELQEAGFDNCVSGKKDAVDEDGLPKYQGIDTAGMTCDIVNTIQYLITENTELKNSIKELLGLIQQLQSNELQSTK